MSALQILPKISPSAVRSSAGDASRGISPPQLVQDCLGYLACSRQGMTSSELQGLLARHGPQLSNDIAFEKLPDMRWSRLYRAFSSYAFVRSTLIDFFHPQLKQAVENRYLSDEKQRVAVHFFACLMFHQTMEGTRSPCTIGASFSACDGRRLGRSRRYSDGHQFCRS